MKTKLLAVPALAAVALLATAQTAAATVTKYQDFSTAGRGAAGYGTATMAVTFTSARYADVGASITDHCPANGLGVYLHLRLRTMDGKYHGLGTTYVNDGCGTTRAGYVTTVTGWGRISHVDGRLCEEDHNGNQASICTGWKAIDNPYT